MDEQNQNPSMGGTISQVSELPQEPAIRPKSKKKIIIGVAVGLVLLIIGMGVVFATGIWDPVWNPLKPSPNKIINQALDNMSKLENVRTKFTINFDTSNSSSEKIEGKMVFDILENVSNPDNPKSKISVDISIVQKGLEMLFGGEIRVVDKVLYFNITTIPIVLRIQLAATGIDIDPFIGNWLRFDPKEAGISFGPTIDEEENQKLANEMSGLIQKYSIFKVKSKLPNEKINNNQAYHYLLTLDEENTKKFILEFSSIVSDQLGSLVSETKSDEEIIAQLDDFFNQTGEIEFEIWIGIKDKYVYKIEIDKRAYTLDAAPDDQLGATSGAQTEEVAMGFEVIFSEFNKVQEIIAPAESINLVELLMPFFQLFMMGGG